MEELSPVFSPPQPHLMSLQELEAEGEGAGLSPARQRQSQSGLMRRCWLTGPAVCCREVAHDAQHIRTLIHIQQPLLSFAVH